jgi:hypothetical protein
MQKNPDYPVSLCSLRGIKIHFRELSLFQNPMVFPQALGKSGLKPAFSRTSKVAVPKLKFWNSLNFYTIYARSATNCLAGNTGPHNISCCPPIVSF